MQGKVKFRYSFFFLISYDFSEAQSGKDVCDRIISPMKGAIRRYCNEGHDIMTAAGMHEALKERKVKGASAAVCELDRGGEEVKVNRITKFSAFHNFSYEQEGLRVRKVYNIGSGRLSPWSELIVQKQGPLQLKEVDNYGFFATASRAIKPPRVDTDSYDNDLVFQFQEQGCSLEVSSLEELQDHIHLGQHSKEATLESLYDGIRRGWVSKFSSLTLESRVTSTVEGVATEGRDECRNMGWALQKPRGGGTRFTENVKVYLTMRFGDGEKTGRKADPTQVAADMRTARDIEGTRKFKRSEWLTKTQVQGFFSRLASMKRRKTSVYQVQEEEDDDENSLIEDEIVYLDETARQHAVEDIMNQVGLIHPITFDGHDICEHARRDTLSRFNVTMLKAMCDHFEIPYQARERKSSLMDKLKDMVKECSCYE